MKTKIYTSLLLLFTFTVSSCTQVELAPQLKCENSCENETVTETISNIRGKIVKINNRYSITIDSTSLASEGYIIGSENILVPCNLEDEYKNVELQVVISGYRKNCCGLLTLPFIWGAFGCKFEITSIEHFTN